MPLVGGSNKISVEAELINNISKRLDVIDDGLDEISRKRIARDKDSAAASINAAKSSGTAWTEFRSIYSTVLDVARVAGQVWEETGGKFVAYAATVRDVSRTLGGTTEEASRLIQVADDVNISYQSLTTSMKLAQKDGIDPSIDGLAKLSDEYLSLAPGIERTKFLLDKFGKSGAEMGKLMEKGGDGIRSMSDAIDESMILSQKAVDEARQYEIAVDSLSDAWDGFTYKVAPPLVGALTDVLNHYRDIGTSLEENGYWYTLTHQLSLDDIAAKREQSDAAVAMAEANTDAGGSFEDLATGAEDAIDPVKTLKDELDKLYAANKEALDFTLSYADFQSGYEKDHAEAVDKVTEAQDKLNLAVADGKDDEAVDGLKNSLGEAQQGLSELEASWHEKTQRMVYDMVLVKLEADGLTEAEMRAAEDLAVKKGITTQDEIEQARALRDEATEIFEGIMAQEDVKRENAKITADLAAAEAGKANSAVSDASVAGGNTVVGMEQRKQQAIAQTTQLLMQQSSMYNMGSVGNAITKRSGGLSPDERDSGGSGVAGVPYMIGTGAQPEIFIPNSNGTFIPNADKKLGGAVYNVNIYNPVAAKSEASVASALKKLSYLGVAK